MNAKDFKKTVIGRDLTQPQLLKELVDAFIAELRVKVKAKLLTPESKISGRECLAIVTETEPWLLEAGKSVGLDFKKGMARKITLAILEKTRITI